MGGQTTDSPKEMSYRVGLTKVGKVKSTCLLKFSALLSNSS